MKYLSFIFEVVDVLLYLLLIESKKYVMPNFVKVLLIIVLGNSITTFAQAGFSHEIGLITGPVAFQSDYGERKDFDTNLGNTGFGIGLVHFLNFSYRADCNCYSPETYFNDHFKVRSELSFNKTKLNHFGKWVTDAKVAKGGEAQKLKAMQGSTYYV